MNERDKLIAELIKEEGGTREQYLSLLNQIAYHESAHTMDPSIKQKGGGPGRGKYQFEAGENRGAITAARRTKRYLDSINGSVPKWLEKAASGNDLDASKLTSAQQDILFLGNMKMHPKADLAKVMKGDESIEEFWANYHWAGPDKDRADRLASFAESKEHYTKNYQPAFKKKLDVLGQPEQKSELAFAQPVQDNTNVQNQSFKTSPTILSTEEQQKRHHNPAFDTESLSDVYSFIKNRKTPTDKNLVSFQGGGTHEQNPLGGIPQGMDASGTPNSVEEGETAFEFGDNKFVFSDRISLTDYLNERQQTKAKSSNQFALGGSMNNTDPTDPKNKKSTDTLKVKSYDDPRYKAYQDSLDLYKYTQLQKQIEPPREQDSYLGLGIVDKPERVKLPGDKENQNTLHYAANQIVRNNPDIKYGIYGNKNEFGDQYPDETYMSKDRYGNPKKVLSAYDSYNRTDTPSWDIHHPNIKPKGTWTGIAQNNDYSNVKPNRTVIVDDKQVTEPIVPREKLNYNNVLEQGDVNFNDEFKADLFKYVKSAPNVDEFEVIEYVKNAFGGYDTSSYTTKDKKKLHQVLKKYEADKFANTRGRDNKVKIKPKK